MEPGTEVNYDGRLRCECYRVVETNLWRELALMKVMVVFRSIQVSF